jgi:Tol biopolymer transport system component
VIHTLSRLFSFSFFLFHFSFSQEAYHPELDWKTIETKNFLVHYHDGAERTAKATAKIAEDIFEPITSLYNHKPDQKVSFIIKDYDDYSNGAAYFYDNKVEIWAPSMDFDFRGTHNWLRNVITHEFTHIVQIQTTMKFGRRMPALYLQWLGYESERRPDVLYGYPNIIASYPISGFLVPAWFAEGVAQYNRPQLRYDFWDSHRDMILRSYALADSMLTWNQMGVFGKTSLGNESAYNAGFAFVHYLAQTYGINKLNEISRNLSSLGATTIDGAIEKAIGKHGEVVYNEWRDELKREYNERVRAIRALRVEGVPLLFIDDKETFEKLGQPIEGKPIFALSSGLTHQHRDRCALFVETGFADRYPTFSPDGKKLAFVSTMGAPSLGQSKLVVAEVGGKYKVLQAGVGNEVSWSPDGKKLYYSRTATHNPHFSSQSDLYVYDIDKEEETRLTFGLRAMTPSVSPDGKRLAFVVGKDGSSNLVVAHVESLAIPIRTAQWSLQEDGCYYTDLGTTRVAIARRLTSHKSGEQVYAPKWSPKGDRIVFDWSVRDGRDIAWIHPDGGEVEFVVRGDDDARNAVFTPDGARMLFNSDRTGIFNIYAMDVATRAISQLTNVLGGAFMPTINADGRLVYSNYTSKGYKLYVLDNPKAIQAEDAHYLTMSNSESALPRPQLVQFAGDATDVFDWQQLRSYDDSNADGPSRQYKSVFTSLSFVPFLRFDNYNTKNTVIDNFKGGVYLFSNDVLDKVGLFAGAALNTKFERDLFATFRYTGKLPLFYQLGLEPVTSLEMYNITRKTDNFVTLNPNYPPSPVNVSYQLTEFDVALTQTIAPNVASIELRYAHSRYTSTIETFTAVIDSPRSTLFTGTDFLYLIGNTLSLKLDVNATARSNTSEINPVGRKITFLLARELNKFNGDGEYDQQKLQQGLLVPSYQNLNFTRVELNWREFIPFFFKHHTLALKLRGGSILERTVDGFFDFYAGGLVGMKGYPFYSISGNEIAVAGLEYRFPLVENIDVRLGQVYFDKFYASVFGDFGNAWNGNATRLKDFKADAGIELRLEAFSWYSYPTRIFVNAAYGFNKFNRIVNGAPVPYGKEMRFYFGVLFGFDFD